MNSSIAFLPEKVLNGAQAWRDGDLGVNPSLEGFEFLALVVVCIIASQAFGSFARELFRLMAPPIPPRCDHAHGMGRLTVRIGNPPTRRPSKFSPQRDHAPA